jgi:alpha-glucosidase (family GH31 glycosyl hydrolase)
MVKSSRYAAALICIGCGGDPDSSQPKTPEDPCNLPLTSVDTPPIHTPRWAFEPWISKDISDTADTYAFVEGFESRGIPVGVVVLDSPWETNYNTFVPNPARYPNFDRLVSDLGQRNVRVVLWMTQMINWSSWDFESDGDLYVGPSPNYEQAERCGFFVDGGQSYTWWKGRGGALDFMNDKAVEWWHRQQDPLFELGVAGFKLDFGDQYVTSDPVETAAGAVPHQQYSEAYYRDFFAYGVHRRGPEEFVTMVRGYDESYQFEGRFFARPEHAPVVWAGDNRRDWIGLADALDHVLRSAEAGYVVVGSDIGGYLDRDDQNVAELVPFDQDVFARWTAIGALMPFMQLHGRANLEPWNVPERADETVELYRYWATFHQELVPFFYSLAEEAYAGAAPIVRPVGASSAWPGDYRFQVGDAFLVAPILDPSGARDVALPAGADWYDWWDPGSAPYPGGTTLAAWDASDRRRIPLFVRSGAIIPMDVTSPLTGAGTAASAEHTTLLVYPAATPTHFVIHDEDGDKTSIELALGSVKLSRSVRPLIVRARAEIAPGSVRVGGSPMPELADRAAFDAAASGWFYDAELRSVWAKTPAAPSSLELTLE